MARAMPSMRSPSTAAAGISHEQLPLGRNDFNEFCHSLGVPEEELFGLDTDSVETFAARSMFSAAPPPEWLRHRDPGTGCLYYVDLLRGASSWSHPQLQLFRDIFAEVQQWHPCDTVKHVLARSRKHLRLARRAAAREIEAWTGPFQVPPSPEGVFDAEAVYYYNTVLGESSWIDPRLRAELDLQCCSSMLSACVAAHARAAAKQCESEAVLSDSPDVVEDVQLSADISELEATPTKLGEDRCSISTYEFLTQGVSSQALCKASAGLAAPLPNLLCRRPTSAALALKLPAASEKQPRAAHRRDSEEEVEYLEDSPASFRTVRSECSSPISWAISSPGSVRSAASSPCSGSSRGRRSSSSSSSFCSHCSGSISASCGSTDPAAVGDSDDSEMKSELNISPGAEIGSVGHASEVGMATPIKGTRPSEADVEPFPEPSPVCEGGMHLTGGTPCKEVCKLGIVPPLPLGGKADQNAAIGRCMLAGCEIPCFAR